MNNSNINPLYTTDYRILLSPGMLLYSKSLNARKTYIPWQYTSKKRAIIYLHYSSHLWMQSCNFSLLLKLFLGSVKNPMNIIKMGLYWSFCSFNPHSDFLVWTQYPSTVLLIQNLKPDKTQCQTLPSLEWAVKTIKLQRKI